MMDLEHGISVHGKHSYTDFGLMFAEKEISVPVPKTVFKDIPYMNGYHDFSKLNGEIVYDPIELKYVFDVVGQSSNVMNILKGKILAWCELIHDEDLIDDDFENVHFAHVSLKDISWKEDDGQGELTITLIAYPFMVSNIDSSQTLPSGNNTVATITTKSDHKIITTIVTTGAFSITVGDTKFIYDQAGTFQSFDLSPGENAVTYTGGPATIRWKDEVF